MSIYQCQKCGCGENTALGHYWCKDEKLCSHCGRGKWHNRFPRIFYPKGACFTNNQGNLEHKESGLIGNELALSLGSKTEINPTQE